MENTENEKTYRMLDHTLTENGFFILVTIVNEKNFKIESSKNLSKNRLFTYMLTKFKWLDYQEEKGVLSNSKKRILNASLDLNNSVEDRLKLKELCSYLKGETVYYRFGDSDKLYANWQEYALEKCINLPTQKELGYKLVTNEYRNVDAIKALPDEWHKTLLNATQLKKLRIPFYKACVGFSDSRYSHVKPEIVNIIPDDFAKQEAEYLEAQKEKILKEKQKIDSMELTPEIIAKCLYSVNKEAKRKRDIHQECVHRAYDWGGSEKYPAVHYNLHKAKQEKNELYVLKDQALHTAIKMWGLQPVGYHKFADVDRDMYVLEGYTFHINEHNSTNCLGEIEDEIDAERKRGIPPKKAVMILERFVSENTK